MAGCILTGRLWMGHLRPLPLPLLERYVRNQNSQALVVAFCGTGPLRLDISDKGCCDVVLRKYGLVACYGTLVLN